MIGRWLFTTLSALSLLLCLAATVLWVRSYWVADEIGCTTGSWSCGIASTRGVLVQDFVKAPPGGYRNPYWVRSAAYTMTPRSPLLADPGVRHHGTALGFSWFVTDGGVSGIIKTPLQSGLSSGLATFTFFPARTYSGPDWFVTLLFAILPAAWLAGWRRRRRWGQSQGALCRHCGYDLRATPARCPECGNMP